MKFNLFALVLVAGIATAKVVSEVENIQEEVSGTVDFPYSNGDISESNDESIIVDVTESFDYEEESSDNEDEFTWNMNGINFIKDNDGNLNKVKISTTIASAEIYMYGATLTSWIVEGQERIFLSPKAVLNGTSAIRGGIPIVFPQFKNDLTADLPFHGFARITTWKLDNISIYSSDKKEISFILTDKEIKEEYLKIWPHQFELVYTVLLDGKSLSTNIKIKNTSNESWLFNTLLHTYYNVNDLTEAGVYGLKDYHYVDTTPAGNGEIKLEEREKIIFQKEVDYIYYDVCQTSFKLQTGSDNEIRVEKNSLPDVIVWNPWIEKSKTLDDFGVESYPHMFCFEVGRVYQPVELDAGAVYEGGQVITIE